MNSFGRGGKCQSETFAMVFVRSGRCAVKITEKLGIYAEPGVVYYFDDGSNVNTIRKEHPFNFNIQLGVRFTLPK